MTVRFTRRQALATCAVGAIPGFARVAGASTYPERPVKLLVGSPPGGPSDFLARLFADAMSPALGGTFVIDNKPGASGTLAADAVAKSAPRRFQCGPTVEVSRHNAGNRPSTANGLAAGGEHQP